MVNTKTVMELLRNSEETLSAQNFNFKNLSVLAKILSFL